MIFNFAYFTALACGNIWCNYAITRTGHDRMEAINSRMTRCMTGAKLKAACDAVPFKHHVRARLFFRDPWKLYDPIVLDAIKNPVFEVPVFGEMIPGGPQDAPPVFN